MNPFVSTNHEKYLESDVVVQKPSMYGITYLNKSKMQITKSQASIIVKSKVRLLIPIKIIYPK